MARARNIKPGFFTNEALVELPFEARLLFIGLWTVADREGRLEDRPKRIKMELFPADQVDVDDLLSQLHAAGVIVRYQSADLRCIEIVSFHKHQKPHPNEAASIIPARDASARTMVISPRDKVDSARASSLNPSSLNDECGMLPSGGTDVRVADATPDCPHEDIVALYHHNCPALTKVRFLNDKRRKAIRTRWRESPERQSLEWWDEFFRSVGASPFLNGANDRGWMAGFDWLLMPANMTKVLEGHYAPKAAVKKPQTGDPFEALRRAAAAEEAAKTRLRTVQ